MRSPVRWGLLAGGVMGLFVALDSHRRMAPSDFPYPRSTVLRSVSFDLATHRRHAPGSDNWPLTWAADDHQYTSWGDGGGFSGTNDRCRVSLGFARIEGSARDFTGRDLWGDSACAPHAARFGGKTRTILALGDTLFFWRSPGSEVRGLDYQRLYRSTDHAGRWEDTGVAWTYDDHRIGFFALLQFGRGYSGARDSFVYIYATALREYAWKTQKPGALYLLRVPRDRLEDQLSYRFFGGLDARGLPRWVPFHGRVPVFRDPNGVMMTSAIYNDGLRRYLLVTNHSRDARGNVGIFDAPEPWGPWTTVLYSQRWPSRREIAPTVFFASFSPKWWSDGGRRFVFVFTGRRENDSFNSVEGAFHLHADPDVRATWRPEAP